MKEPLFFYENLYKIKDMYFQEEWKQNKENINDIVKSRVNYFEYKHFLGHCNESGSNIKYSLNHYDL